MLIRPLLSLPFSSLSFESIMGMQDREMREHLCPDGRIVFPYAAGKDECIDRRERGSQAEKCSR